MEPQPSTTAPAGAYNGDAITQQPNTQPQPVYAKYAAQTGTEGWSNDIFDCFNSPDELCLKGTFCPCFVYGKTQARTRDPTLASYERFNPDCMMFAGASFVCGLSWILTFIKRREIRQQFQIKGDDITDCGYSYLCHCCSLIQIEKETCARTGTPYTPVAGAVADQGYVKSEGMSAEPGAEAGAGP